MVQQIKEEKKIDDMYGRGWHDGMMMTNGLVGGIIPSWEGGLKFETRTKLHLRKNRIMDIIIALDSSFREVELWYKYHLILTSRNRILNLFFLMHKLWKVNLSQM